MKSSRLVALGTAGLIGLLTACSPATTEESGPAQTSGTSSQSASTQAEPAMIMDTRGNHITIPAKLDSIVATDNRIFETLSDRGVKLSAAPVNLISSEIAYKKDSSIVNLGSHKEPDLEAVVAAQPDLILNGQRFGQYYEDFQKLVPDAVIVDTNIDEEKPYDEELIRQTETLGQIFGKEAEAAKLVDDFKASIERVKAADDPSQKVMGVITSGGEINYAAPHTGRSLGPIFDILGLTPALSTEGSTDHEGDNISVETIADSNPDLILVMDRAAATSANSGEDYTPANELLANSAALKNVTAVKNGNIAYMPQDTYVNEGIQTYTEFFNSLANKLEQS